MGDYPRIPQVINEIKGFAKIYLTKGIRLNILFIPSPPSPYRVQGSKVCRGVCGFPKDSPSEY